MEHTLEEYQLFLRVQYRKRNSQIRYLNAAEKLLDYITELSAGEIQRYLIHLNQTQKPNSVTSNIVGLNRYLEYLQRPDLRVSTPNWKPITRDTITKEQIIQLIDYAKKNLRYMDYLILLMVRDLDCRNHEIVKTQWSWIHGEKILFQDCKTGDTTGRLTPELTEALQHWRTTTPYPNNPSVFTIQKGPFKGQPLAGNGWYIRNLINRVSLEVIGRRLNPQDLRASVITAEYTAYVNPKIIQLKARHRSEKTTQRYNHIDESLVATYIESGTIFNTNNNPVLKSKPGIPEDKRGYINTLLLAPENSLNQETEDNDCFSFSITFFKYQQPSGALGTLFSCINLHSYPPTTFKAQAPVLLNQYTFSVTEPLSPMGMASSVTGPLPPEEHNPSFPLPPPHSSNHAFFVLGGINQTPTTFLSASHPTIDHTVYDFYNPIVPWLNRPQTSIPNFSFCYHIRNSTLNIEQLQLQLTNGIVPTALYRLCIDYTNYSLGVFF